MPSNPEMNKNANRPNIIFLTIDTLRLDRIGCYGCPRPLTPNIDRLASRSLRFNQAITGGSWTQAAFPVLMSSTYASMYGGCLGALAARRPSPIEAFAENGYATAGFSSSPLLSKQYGYQRGFQYFLDLEPSERDPRLRKIKGGQKLLRMPATHRISRLLGISTRPARIYVSAQELTDRMTAWMEKTTQPFLVWSHFMDVHWPYHLEDQLVQPNEIAQAWRDIAHLHAANWKNAPISPQQREHYIKLYEQAVAYVDEQIGRLLDFLEMNNLFDNTIIVLTADHGEEFQEHGRWGHWENNLYDEILKVPFLLHLPGSHPPQVVQRQIRTLDLMPTLLELSGVPAPKGMLGESFSPLWRGPDEDYQPEVSLSEMWRKDWHIVAVRTETHKYIYDSKKPAQAELYELFADPHEKVNVASQYPELARRLHEHVEYLLALKSATTQAEETAEPELDEAMISRLRDLGYVE